MPELLVERYRPQTIDDIILEPSQKAFFKEKIQQKDIPHLLFISAPGSGKTSLAKILVKEMDKSYRYINASDERGIDDIRNKVITFAQTQSFDGTFKVVILDESDGLLPDSQRILRNVMEEYSANVRFILTANYKNRIIEPLRSRTQEFILVPPFEECIKRVVHIIKQENIIVPVEQKESLHKLIKVLYPDLRSIINNIDKFTINKKLQIPENKTYTILFEKIFNMVYDKNVVIGSIRKFLIENESEFNSNYLTLLKGLFEHIFINVTEENQKRESLLTIGKYMESHQQVMDFEINAFCCMIQLKKIFTN